MIFFVWKTFCQFKIKALHLSLENFNQKIKQQTENRNKNRVEIRKDILK
jgi:hypothetical protein